MGILDKAKNLGAKTIEEGKKYAEVTKLNVAISSYEEQIKECKIMIGDIVMENGLPLQADHAQMNEQLQKITELKQKIEETQNKINVIKNINICDSCGAEVTNGEKFCGKCGKPMKTIDEVLQTDDSSRKCSACNTEVKSDTAFCPNCGQEL